MSPLTKPNNDASRPISGGGSFGRLIFLLGVGQVIFLLLGLVLAFTGGNFHWVVGAFACTLLLWAISQLVEVSS